MEYKRGRGVRLDYHSENDGFIDHVARRGVEKTATGLVWVFLLLIAAAVIGLVTSTSVGVVIAVVVGVALMLAYDSRHDARNRPRQYTVACPHCAAVVVAPAGAARCVKCSRSFTVTPKA